MTTDTKAMSNSPTDSAPISNEQSASSLEVSTPSTASIVEQVIPGVRWSSPTKGLCQCPGHQKHSTRSTKKDCAVFIGGSVPTVYCFHEGCAEEILAANDAIRTLWRAYQPEIPAEQLAGLRAEQEWKRSLEARIVAAKDRILADSAWNLDLDGLDMTPDQMFSAWKGLWKDNDNIWIGEPHESGQWFHKAAFGQAEDMTMRGHYSCASTFKEATISRGNEFVESTPFLIVEGDKVLGEVKTEEDKVKNKLACAAIFRWLDTWQGRPMKLLAVIDSGNKSLHGWFTMPSPAIFKELQVTLPAIGCDRAMFKPTQPARVPGIVRDNGNLQKLIYLA